MTDDVTWDPTPGVFLLTGKTALGAGDPRRRVRRTSQLTADRLVEGVDVVVAAGSTAGDVSERGAVSVPRATSAGRVFAPPDVPRA